MEDDDTFSTQYALCFPVRLTSRHRPAGTYTSPARASDAMSPRITPILDTHCDWRNPSLNPQRVKHAEAVLHRAKLSSSTSMTLNFFYLTLITLFRRLSGKPLKPATALNDSQHVEKGIRFWRATLCVSDFSRACKMSCPNTKCSDETHFSASRFTGF